MISGTGISRIVESGEVRIVFDGEGVRKGYIHVVVADELRGA